MSKTVVFIFFMVSFCLLLGSFRGKHTLSNFLALKKSHLLLLEAVNALELETNKVEKEILHLRSSTNYVSKVLRDKYHIIEDGEKIIFFAD